MKKIFAILLTLGLAASAAAKVNFPYPQEKAYAHGTYQAGVSAKVKARFIDFYNALYKEDGNYARIGFDDPNYTVSEGIGYGMIMMVYFSDNTTSYQSQFDKLWNYYQKWQNSNGLMHWKINGFSSITENNAALDADEDVAFALAMAYYQFGDEKYKTAASALIAKIRSYEFETDGLHKPGDMWNDKRNPSYVSPAAYEIFKSFDNANFWNTAITRNYTFLKENQNASTGLPSDWSTDNQYGYDAARAPWRWAWSYAWYGHSDASTLLAKLAPWVNGKYSANDLSIPMNQNGSGGSDNNSTAVGPLTCALMYSNTYASKLSSFTTSLLNTSGERYFSAAMQVLTGLLISGNMQNFAAMTPGASSSSTVSSSSTASSSPSGKTSVIDDFEDGNNIANTGLEDYWYAFTDVGNDGLSSIQNVKEEGEYQVVSDAFANGSDYGVGLKGIVLNKGSNENEPYVTLGLNVEDGLAGCQTFTYDYKGAAHNFKVVMEGDEEGELTGYAYHQSAEVAMTSWGSTSISVSTGLQQPGWASLKPTLNIAKVVKVQWEVKGAKTAGNQTPTPNYLYIDNFACDGMSITPVVIPDESSSSGTPTSSTTTSSSSSAIEPSSSSVAPVVPSPMIEDFEDGDNQASTGGYWFVYNDKGDKGASTFSNAADPNGGYVVVFDATNSTSYMGGLKGIALDKGGNANDPYVALGLNITEEDVANDFSACTEISYDYIGAAHNFKAVMKGDAAGALTGYARHESAQTSATTWSHVALPWPSGLTQPSWGTTATLDAKKISAFHWEVKGTASPNYLYIDNFKCEGMSIVPPTSSSSTVNPPSSSSTGGPVVVGGRTTIDDFEDGNTAAEALANAYWYIYTAGGNVSNTKTMEAGYSVWNMIETETGNSYAAMTGISGVVSGSDTYPSVGMGFDMQKGAFAGCSAIEYDYKGSGHQFRVAIDGVTADKGYEHITSETKFPAVANWTTVSVSASDLVQPDWIPATEKKAFSWALAKKVAWVVSEKLSAANIGTELAVDNVKCVGTLPSPIPASSSSVIPNSSSSVYNPPYLSINAKAAKQGLNVKLQGNTLNINVAKAGLVKVQVFDLTGHTIEAYAENMSVGMASHSLAGLAKGSYIVRVQQGSLMNVVKVQIR